MLQLDPTMHEKSSYPIIVDTDAGPDDLLALGYLLVHPLIQVEAITISYGLADAECGAINVARIVAAFARGHIPVYIGHSKPSVGEAAFPQRWRRLSNDLPGVSLPKAYIPPEEEHAVSFLQRRLSRASRPVRVLALGALTNLVTMTRATAPAIEELVIMGGAFNVSGNVNHAEEFVSPTQTSEWNFYADPLAASTVFSSDLPITLIPLDATNQVPVKIPFIDQFTKIARCPVGRMTSQVLEAVRPHAEQGVFYAWDPLAAVYLVHPNVVSLERFPVSVQPSGPNAGTSRKSNTGYEFSVAMDADGELFMRYFIAPFVETSNAYS